MKAVTDAETYIQQIIARFRNEGYVWHEEVSLRSFAIKGVASRKKFELTKFGMSEYFFVFMTAPSMDADTLKEFSSACFDMALRMKSTWFPRGLFAGVWCFPVVIVERADPELIQFVKTEVPTSHWAAMELPVCIELATQNVFYLAKTPVWGFAYYAGFRRLIRELFLTT